MPHGSVARMISSLGSLAVAGGIAASSLAAQVPVTLGEAIRRAQEQGFEARAAAATRDASRYRDQAFYSGLLPQLSLGGILPSFNRSIIQVVQPDGSTVFRPQDLTTGSLTATLSQRIPGIGGDLFVSSALSQLSVSGPQSVRTWSSTPVLIGIRQPIFRPNLLAWDRKEQPVRHEVSERRYREEREDIAVTTTGLFFDVYSARMLADNARTNAAVNDTLYTLNQGRYNVGRIGENDLLQSELALLRARNALDATTLDLERAQAALRLAMNLPASITFAIVAPTTIPSIRPDTIVAVDQALRNRATVTDVALQRLQARRRVTEARLNQGIGATLSASLGYNATGGTASAAYQNLQEARQFSLAVDIPVFRWGQHGEEVQAARADQEETQNSGEETLQRMVQAAHFAALQLLQAQRSLELSAKADTVAGRRFEVAYNRYVIGRISIDNLFLAQSEKDQAVLQYVQALRGYWSAYGRLRRETMYDFERGEPIH